MTWDVLFHHEFRREFEELPLAVREDLLAHVELLETFGPSLGRPRVDTLKGSRHSNMKELRFDAEGGVWRVAFVFDPQRNAICLVAGDKRGANERRFYAALIATADARFTSHLASIKNGGR